MKQTFIILLFSILLLSCFVSAQQSGFTDGMISYYNFTANANDYMKVNNGTAYGNTDYVTGIVGNAARFDGNADYINISDNTIFQDDSKKVWSVMFWIYINKTSLNNSNERYIHWKHENGTEYMNVRGRTSKNVTQFSTGDSGGVMYNLLVDRAWYLVTITADGTQGYLYFNKTLMNKSNSNDFLPLSNGNIMLSRYDTTSLNGSIDELSFWSINLTQPMIDYAYDKMVAGYSLTEPLTYYVCQNGSDSNNGLSITTPIKTITKVNTLTLYGGDSVLFCAGNKWEAIKDAWLVPVSGDSYGNITYGKYGNGAKPIISGESNLSYVGNWSDEGSNKWCSPANSFQGEVGELWFNAQSSYSTNKTNSALYAQGVFFYNESKKNVCLYSVGNPATYYDEIIAETQEGTTDEPMIHLNSQSYVVIKDLDLRFHSNGAIGGTDVHDIFIYNLTAWYTGGGFAEEGSNPNTRMGNAIGFGLNQTNIKVKWNNVNQGYDACYSPQAWSSSPNRILTNQEWSYNIGSYCYYGFEIFNTATAGGLERTENISVHHNTFAFSGFGHGKKSTRDSTFDAGKAVRATTFNFTYNISFMDNIYYNSSDLHVYYATTSGKNVYSDYNLFYNGSNILDVFSVWAGSSDYSLTALQSRSKNDSHSIALGSGQVFYDADSLIFNPINTSPVCLMSSTGSYIGALPCIGAAETPLNETNVSTTGNSTYFNITLNASSYIYSFNFTQKPYIIKSWLNLNNINPITSILKQSADTCSGASCTTIDDDDNSSYYLVYHYADGDSTTAIQTVTLSDTYKNKPLNYSFIWSATSCKYGSSYFCSVVVTCKDSDGVSRSVYSSTPELSSWASTVVNNKIPYECLNEGTMTLTSVFSASIYGEVRIYETMFSGERAYNITIDNYNIFSSMSESNNTQSINTTETTRTYSTDAQLIYNFSALGQNTFNSNITIDYLYSKEINVTIKDSISNTTLNPSCYFNGELIYPLSELINYNSSQDNILDCSLLQFGNLTYSILPLYDSINLSMTTFGINITIYNEITNKQIINESLFIYLIQGSYSKNYSIISGNLDLSNISIPTGLFEIQYGGENYSTRRYFISLTNTTNLQLYTLPKSNASLILFSITDERGFPVDNAYLKVQRFFIEDNAWKLIGMELTDLNGQSGMYLEPYNIPYIFLVEKGGRVVYRSSTTGTKVFSSDIYLRAILSEDVLASYDLLNRYLTTSLTYDNVSKTLTYFWNDASGITLYGCLEATRTGSTGRTKVVNQCTQSSSGTISVDMSPYLLNNTDFSARGYVHTNTAYSELTTDITEWTLKNMWSTFGLTGLFMGYIFILTMFLLGLTMNFPVATVYTILSLVVIQLVGFAWFGWALIVTISILGIIFAGVSKQ